MVYVENEEKFFPTRYNKKKLRYFKF